MSTPDLLSARFPHMRAGYESYYLRTARPEGGLGVWIRYTVHRRPGHAPTGSLWFTLFDADALAPSATKVTLEDPRTGDGAWIRIGAADFGPGTCRGAAAAPGGADVSWELSFSGAPLLATLPKAWMYRAPLPRTKPVSVYPVARVSGTVVVDGRRIDLDAWPGMVGHNWGTEHAERWIWLHGMAFDGAGEDTWLDVVLGRLRIAGRTTPWTASGTVSVDGERLALGGPGRIRSTRIDEHPDHLVFGLTGRGVRVTGAAQAPRERFVGWIYADPDGSTHHTVNCSIADLELTVARDGQPPRTLTAPGLAAYELGMRERDHGMTIQPFADG
ncbi:hypothetical protein DSM112329_01195 [Paraconexibacter sp. AEG42_29]|uniref:AttH domain-containing protein n=1 Tax=Paraconexibacter sp. AEG42_29 TaxID=2997339 RepID=A0AAU7ARS5_9ACTN